MPIHQSPPESHELHDLNTRQYNSASSTIVPYMDTRPATNVYYADGVDDIDDNEVTKDEDARERRRLMFRLGASFFLFGLINNGMCSYLPIVS